MARAGRRAHGRPPARRQVPFTEQAMNLGDIWLLDPQITFLNHGSFGACPRPVLEEQDRLRLRLEREPVAFFNHDYRPLLDAARAALASFAGADSAGLVFVTNATAGVNAVLQSHPLAPGDEILVTNHGYGACTNAAMFTAERRGACVRHARVPFPLDTDDAIVDAVLREVTPRTRLALIDHVTSPTALIFPVARLVAELEGRGVACLIDGAHAPGMLPLAVGGLGASYYTGNCHKWMCCPKGAAFLWTREDHRAGLKPGVISHGLTCPTVDRSRLHHLFDWPGTYDPTAVLAIPRAIAAMEGLVEGGWDALRRRNHDAACRARELLCAGLNFAPCAPPDLLGSMASILLPPGFGGFCSDGSIIPPLQRWLFDVHRVEAPVFPWEGGRFIVRVSAQLYNTEEDYARLRDALLACR